MRGNIRERRISIGLNEYGYEMNENVEIPMPCMQVGKELGKLLKEII